MIDARIPPGRRAISAKWVLKYKRDEFNTIVRRKSRLVARGFEQREGLDYNEAFAPTVKSSLWRVILALSLQLERKVTRADIVTAYLEGKLDEEIYMDRFPLLDDFMSDSRFAHRAAELGFTGESVILLGQAIYGLRQSGRQWHAKLKAEMDKIGMKQLRCDTAIYTGQGKGITTLSYVGTPADLIARDFYDSLGNDLKIKELGSPRFFLDVAIWQTDATITLSQKGYIEKILNDFGMAECDGTSTPMAVGSY